jgi:hypothetical protein
MRYRNQMALGAAVAGMVVASLSADPVGAASPKAVIELFTSQGCSSCPPADELLAVLAKRPDVIALSMPVDYWDYLGWKDTLAKPAFTQRQRVYSTNRGDRQVYTPQAVINGLKHANGSSVAEIEGAIAATSSAIAVPITLSDKAGSLEIGVGAGSAVRGTVIALPVLGKREVAIGRGENARRKVAYTNVVREIIALGSWDGAAAVYSIPRTLLEGADSVVILLQAGNEAKPFAIMGTARLELR